MMNKAPEQSRWGGKRPSASFEPLQGGSAPLPAQASTPLQRFGPAALVPAPDERGHDGWELRAPPDTSLQASSADMNGTSLGSDR